MKRLGFLLPALITFIATTLSENLKRLPSTFTRWLLNQFSIELTMKARYYPDDLPYQWMKEYLHAAIVKPRAFTIVGRTAKQTDMDRRPLVIFTPTAGVYFTLWREDGARWPNLIYSRFFQNVDRNKKEDEGYLVRVFCKDPGKAVAFTEYLRNLHAKTNEREVMVSEIDSAGQIGSRSWKRGRDLTSIVWREGQMEDLISDIQQYRDGFKRYEALGVPYRRGYGFEGPPGNGKSSAVLAMAHHLNMNVRIINIKSVTADGLKLAMSNCGTNDIVLMEDVDCAIATGDRDKSAASSVKVGTDGKVVDMVTLDVLLNAIDGANAAEGRVLIMTTNRIEVLDAALTRPGRMDRKFHVGNATRCQAKRMFLRFFPGEEKMAAKFAGRPEFNSDYAVKDERGVEVWYSKVSMARVQKHLWEAPSAADAAYSPIEE